MSFARSGGFVTAPSSASARWWGEGTGQKTSFRYEVIIIDSGSTDRTLDIAGSYHVKLHHISNSEFNHGETRNLGARLASGQFVAYLTQDATPASRVGDRGSGFINLPVASPQYVPPEGLVFGVFQRPVASLKSS